jgi:hypothetical protein
MEPKVTVGVYRRLDNRFEGLSDDSPRALELHNWRREALHEVLDSSKPVRVLDWGYTDDTVPHEYVELVLGAAASAAFSYAIVPGLKFLGKKLAEKTVDHATSEMVKALVSWLRPKQEEKKVLDFVIKLADGTRIQVDPPDRDASLTVTFNDGRVESVHYLRGVGRRHDGGV